MNVHYQFNIMILRSMDMVQWLLNTMLDDARHIGRMRSVIAEKLLIETITQQHRLCRVIERTGETLQWMMMTTHLVNGDTDCRLLMNFLLSTVNDVQGGHDSSSSSLLTGYVTMQITLFRVLMALPTLMTQVQAHEQAQGFRLHGDRAVRDRHGQDGRGAPCTRALCGERTGRGAGRGCGAGVGVRRGGGHAGRAGTPVGVDGPGAGASAAQRPTTRAGSRV